MRGGARRLFKLAVTCCWLLVVTAGSVFGAPTFLISGYVQTSGGTGISGVKVATDNNSVLAITQADGSYSIRVPNHWDGTIYASKSGWLITPASKTYSNVRRNLANENYMAYQPKISGYVKKTDGTPLGGTTISATGGISTKADAIGYYEIMVGYDWSGSLIAAKPAYSVVPVQHSFANLTNDQNDIDFTGTHTGTITVKPDGTGDCSTIQAAVDEAVNQDVIILESGTYTGTGNRDIDFKGKSITVRSMNGPYSTIIDCQGTQQDPHRGFTFHSGESSGSIVSGLSIVNGYGPDEYGYYETNKYYSSGGAIHCRNSSPSISNCILENNGASYFGAAIACLMNSSPILTNLVISDNSSQNRGGGIYCFWYSSPSVVHCTIAENSAPLGGGGLYTESYSQPSVSNSILWGNVTGGTTAQITGTATVRYSDIQLGWTGSGNIDSDPLFSSDGHFNLTWDSPCIDAAANWGVYYDILGNIRPCDFPGVDNNGSQFDMGAYEVGINDLPMLSISGYVKKADGTVLSGVTVTADNGGSSTTTNASGYYELTVSYGWSGTVSASLAGYGFIAKTYANVKIDRPNQDFTSSQQVISGTVTSYGATFSGVTLTANNGGGTAVTDSTGNYSFTVPYGWSGIIIPTKSQYTFAPANRVYSNVTIDTALQNYAALLPPVSISGYVRDSNGTGIVNVNIASDNGGGSAVTNSDGYYSVNVPYNWSGAVTANNAKWHITPAKYSYMNLCASQSGQNFAAIYVGLIIKSDGTGNYPTIQAGIDAAITGEVINLEAGTYTGTGNRDIDFKGKAITVRGATGDPNDCVIDCQGSAAAPHRGFKFVNGETADSVLENVKIINGYAPQESAPYTGYFGGAIFNYMSSPKINNCIISGNKAQQCGGGICNYNSNAIISNCVISSNSTLNSGYMGGGIYNEKGSPTISNCIIKNNESSGGGGIRNQSTSPIIRNCLITGNYAAFGGGIYDYNSAPIIRNCVISGNGSQEGGAFSNVGNDNPQITSCTIFDNGGNYGGAFRSSTSGLTQLVNCIVWGNRSYDGPAIYGSNFSLTYSDVQGGKTGIGNINANPLFTDGYHLPADSPCVNTGNPAYIAELNETDIDGDPRMLGRIDMGADEKFVSVGLKVSKNAFAFEMPGLNTHPAPQILTVTNYGAYPMNWHIENSCNWLRIEPSSGQTGSLESTQVMIGIDSNNVSYGAYSCQFGIVDPCAENSPQTVMVNLNVIGPEIGLSKTSYSISALGKGSSVVRQDLIISNTGINTLNWQIQMPSDCNWLSVTPQSGTITDGNSTVALSLDSSKANYGTNSCQFTIEAPDATNTPQTVTVNLNVGGPFIDVYPSYMEIYAAKDGGIIEKTLTIQNIGYDTLHWYIKEVNDCNWITAITPETGACERNQSQTVTIRIDPQTVENGFYSKIIEIWSTELNDFSCIYINLQVCTPNEIHVPADYNTIQEAIIAANFGDTIIVHPGRYAGFNNYEKVLKIQSIDPENPAVVGATIIESTAEIIGGDGLIIDGLSFIYNPARLQDYQSLRGINVRYGGQAIKNCIIRNFPEGGIYVSASSQGGSGIRIANCLITHNGYSYNYSGYPVIYGSPAAGICIDGRTEAEISNCLVSNNYCGGITLGTKGTLSAQLTNCTIADNGSNLNSLLASGITIGDYTSVSIKNSIIYSDVNLPQIAISQHSITASLDVDHSLIKGGQSGISGPNTAAVNLAAGNIESAPYFAKTGILDDNNNGDRDLWDDHWFGGDYHLKSCFGRWVPSEFINMDASGDGIMEMDDFAVLASEWQTTSRPVLLPPLPGTIVYHPYLRADLDRNGIVDFNDLAIFCGSYGERYEIGQWVYDDVNSPCIDAGDANSEWRQELWPHGRRVNMGAYGNTTQASMSSDLSGNAIDLNKDGRVNLIDYAQCVKGIDKPSYTAAEDINRDGLIDLNDLWQVCRSWLWSE